MHRFVQGKADQVDGYVGVLDGTEATSGRAGQGGAGRVGQVVGASCLCVSGGAWGSNLHAKYAQLFCWSGGGLEERAGSSS